jgi:hypothetical protein
MDAEEILEPAIDTSLHMVCRTRDTRHKNPGKEKRSTVFKKRSHVTELSMCVPPPPWIERVRGAFGKKFIPSIAP